VLREKAQRPDQWLAAGGNLVSVSGKFDHKADRHRFRSA
jgi:hypothetical protein